MVEIEWWDGITWFLLDVGNWSSIGSGLAELTVGGWGLDQPGRSVNGR